MLPGPAIPGHPFDLGRAWNDALRGQLPDWEGIYDGYAAGARRALDVPVPEVPFPWHNQRSDWG